MNLKELIKYVFEHYPIRKPTGFNERQGKGDPLVSIIKKGLTQIENSELVLGERYSSKGSAGMGEWATIPWIGLFDHEISMSAKKGFDLVYLFSADLKTVYLSLNQGWNFYQNKYSGKSALENITKVSEYWRSRLTRTTDSMTGDSIDLHASQFKNTKLPRGYEQGSILNIEYRRDNLPDNVTLTSDLLAMRTVLEELKRQLFSPDDLEISIAYILRSTKKCQLPVDSQLNTKSEKKIDYSSLTNMDLEKAPQPSGILQDSNPGFLARSRDYAELQRDNTRVGFLGEILVLKKEKKSLIDAGKVELANQVEHVSQTQGDGLGYDIKSFYPNGSLKYIEVKTTWGHGNLPFFLSQNEMKFSKENKNQYVLVRVYDLPRNGHVPGKFYEIKGDLSQQLDISPQTYVARFDKGAKK